MSRQEEIARRLRAALRPTRLRIQDETALHIGHWGDSPTSESHFRIEIVSAQFAGLGRLARQRAVHRALGKALMGKLHAVAIRARAPDDSDAV